MTKAQLVSYYTKFFPGKPANSVSLRHKGCNYAAQHGSQDPNAMLDPTKYYPSGEAIVLANLVQNTTTLPSGQPAVKPGPSVPKNMVLPDLIPQARELMQVTFQKGMSTPDLTMCMGHQSKLGDIIRQNNL